MAGFPPDDQTGASPAGPDPRDADRSGRTDGELDWERFLGASRADEPASHTDEDFRPLSRREARNRENQHRENQNVGAQNAGLHNAGAQNAGAPHAERVTASAASPHRLREHAPREKRRGPWGCLIALIVVVAVLAGGYIALQGPLSQVREAIMGPGDYTGTGNKDVVVTIQAGENGSDVANTLVKNDVVKSFDAFYKLLLAQRSAPVFHPGSYQLKTQMSAQSALDALLDRNSRVDATVVIPEGTAEADVLQLVADGTGIPLDALKKAAADPKAYGLPAEAKTLEGFLFPATYTFAPGTTAGDAIKTMVDRQFQALDDAGVAPANRWRTIVLASLVQREAGLHDDYYKVARVFLNRLNPDLWPRGVLQSDATVAYGTGNTHLVTTTDKERQDASNPYNTYLHPGLPPGPISNPGDLAIDAALHPAAGPWLYFVTWNLETGETIFSTTAEQHQAAVDKWLKWMDAHPKYK